MSIALYVRVACRDPRDDRITSQLGALREWAAANGHVVTREFVDHGFSGLRSDRPGLDALRSAAASGAFEAVLVAAPDRLSRVAAECLGIVDELKVADVRVTFALEP
jgi:DNA invertase Pin-like site-specific DNA recombinase